ncbi:MAG TPA: hypothetical protein PLB02_02285 [Thermoanaerobaculia bacterium]|nr:hypothetical protein [Thermoanaerobaculia bacterium]
MRRRGFALVAVTAVLALLLLVFAVLAKLLSGDLADTRRRANAGYARELSLSGLAWARAAIARGGALAPETLEVAGGRIEVTPEITDRGLRVVSVGLVTSGGAVVARHAAALEAGTSARPLLEPPAAPVPDLAEPPVTEEPPAPETATPVPVPERRDAW